MLNEKFASLPRKMDFYLTTSASSFPCFQIMQISMINTTGRLPPLFYFPESTFGEIQTYSSQLYDAMALKSNIFWMFY